jgi:hypothetical protein
LAFGMMKPVEASPGCRAFVTLQILLAPVVPVSAGRPIGAGSCYPDQDNEIAEAVKHAL